MNINFRDDDDENYNRDDERDDRIIQTRNSINEQRRRQKILQLGLMLCFILMLFDGNNRDTKKNNNDISNYQNDLISNSKSNIVYTNRLNNVINSYLDKNSLKYIAKYNASGIYRGTWDDNTISLLEQSHTKSYQSSYNNMYKDRIQRSGKLFIQLKTTSVSNVDNLDFLFGVVKLYGAGPKASDLLYPIQGVALTKQGIVSLVSTPSITHRAVLQLPSDDEMIKFDSNWNKNNINSNNNQVNKSIINNEKKSRYLIQNNIDDNSNSNNNNNNIFSLFSIFTNLITYTNNLECYLEIKSISSFSTIFENLQIFNIMNEDYNENIKLYDIENNNNNIMHRTLVNFDNKDDTNILNSLFKQSINIGDTLLKLHVIDIDKLPKTTSLNKTKSYVQVGLNPFYYNNIGDGLLPLTFQSLQLGNIASSNVNPLSCPYSLQLSSLIENNTTINQNNNDLLKMNEKVQISKENKDNYINENYFEEFTGKIDSDCGMHINITTHAYRLQMELLEKKAGNYSIMAINLCVFQIFFIILQMKYSQTQAGAAKISIICICYQAILDATLCVGHLLLCAGLPSVFFNYFLWIALLKLILFCILEMRIVISIYQSRYSQELAQEGMAGLRRRLATLHLRFYGVFFLMLFLFFINQSSPLVIVFLFYSCWIPQIIYNSYAGTRNAFHPIYLYGMAISRLFIPLYFLGCPSNFVIYLVDKNDFKISYFACFVLILWTAFQVSIIILQDKYGSRFFIPRKFLPERYDYYRHYQNVRNDEEVADEEDGLVNECIICYNNISLTSGEYMVTPCDHLFHKNCLNQWLDIKMECPVCRSVLPAVDPIP